MWVDKIPHKLIQVVLGVAIALCLFYLIVKPACEVIEHPERVPKPRKVDREKQEGLSPYGVARWIAMGEEGEVLMWDGEKGDFKWIPAWKLYQWPGREWTGWN